MSLGYIFLTLPLLSTLASADNQWTLRMIEGQRANKTGARCLDGSPAGYYVKAGDPSKLVLSLQGGGYCSNIDKGQEGTGCGGLCDCRERTKTPMGSSKFFKPAPTMDGSMMDIVFPTWTQIYIPYCSGDMWSGAQTESVEGIYFGGHRILAQVLADAKAALPGMKEFVLTGCSAGGIGTVINTDFTAKSLPGVKVHGMPFSGWFLDDWYDLGNKSSHGWVTRWVHATAMQGSQGTPLFEHEACRKRYGENNGKCWSAHWFAAEVETPLFFVEDQYDQAQLQDYGATATPAGEAFAQEFGAHMRGSFERLNNTQHAVYAPSCFAHCLAYRSANGSSIAGQSLKDSFWAWYNSGTKGERRVEACADGKAWPPCGSLGQLCSYNPWKRHSIEVV